MKFYRTCRCHFGKWLTKKKKEELKEILAEFVRLKKYFAEKYGYSVSNIPVSNFTLASNLYQCDTDTNTFLTHRMIKQAFCDAYATLKGNQLLKEEGYIKKSSSVCFKSLSMGLSECSVKHGISINSKEFDYFVTLYCIRTDKGYRSQKEPYTLTIPLKRHRQFNKWLNAGNIVKSVRITENYVEFSFEITVPDKKDEGEFLGMDIGIKKLFHLSNKNTIGDKLSKYLFHLKRKKKYSKAYYRSKSALKYYINKELKRLPWDSLQLVVMEDLRGFKHNKKKKGTLPKYIRSVLTNLNTGEIMTRIQLLCEENRVAFRRVPCMYSSLECSRCGHIEKKNRLSQELFVCQKCGHSDNADYNASQTILKRFINGRYGSVYQQRLLDKLARQTPAISEDYMKNHQAYDYSWLGHVS